MIHLTPKLQPMTRRYPAAAFTLVEVLVVLVLVSIMAGMVLTAVQGVTTSARMARTRSIISIVDSVIQEQYEAFKYRPFRVVTPDVTTLPNPDMDNLFGYDVLSSESARVRLNMLRDMQRMELPDRKSDIVINGQMNLPAQLSAAVSPVARFNGRIGRNPAKSARRPAPVPWYEGGTSAPARFLSYYRRALPGWTEQYESSECLYLILSTTFVGGAPAIEMIPASNIGDLDNDGMPEILDGWARPIEFIRWPSGFEDPELSIQGSIPDDFDLFQSDFGYLASSPPHAIKPWSMRPLIISAGADAEFGIVGPPLNESGNPISFRYNAATPSAPTASPLMTWPISAPAMGEESEGRGNGTYIFVDPYLRHMRALPTESLRVAVLPGSPITGQQSVRADNITNYQLAASE